MVFYIFLQLFSWMFLIVTLRASNSPIFAIAQALFWPCQPIIDPWWQDLHKATTV